MERYEFDLDDVVIDRVETIRWNNEWAPSDSVLQRAADDPLILGPLVDGTINNPEWRDSALTAFSQLNAEAARRAFNSGDYLASVHYQSRHQALELVRNLAPSLQTLNDSLIGAGELPTRHVARPLVDGISGSYISQRSLGEGAPALSFLKNVSDAAGQLGGSLFPSATNQSMTVNISMPTVDPSLSSQAEELSANTYRSHLYV
ncbi:hypothetical protein [Nocardia sp. CC227C]|uniref:hypothetical protein n=1 Tax=Nocardia sp. CC227C TaxID=3044562 RepID=UPI00278C58FD|nr:hypothetical protein [Nocardia sp. CC227C]